MKREDLVSGLRVRVRDLLSAPEALKGLEGEVLYVERRSGRSSKPWSYYVAVVDFFDVGERIIATSYLELV